MLLPFMCQLDNDCQSYFWKAVAALVGTNNLFISKHEVTIELVNSFLE